MLSLNLVSNELKKEIKRRKLYSMLTGLIYFLIIIVVLFSSFIFYTERLIVIKMSNIVNQSYIINNNSQVLNNKILKINSLIDYSALIQKDFTPWTCFLNRLVTNNKGIKFQTINISKKNMAFSIKGFAKTRDDLLAYKKLLEDGELLKEVNLPFNSLLSKDDINFEITAKINSDKLPTIK